MDIHTKVITELVKFLSVLNGHSQLINLGFKLFDDTYVMTLPYIISATNQHIKTLNSFNNSNDAIEYLKRHQDNSIIGNAIKSAYYI
jgi:hypothetical protein